MPPLLETQLKPHHPFALSRKPLTNVQIQIYHDREYFESSELAMMFFGIKLVDQRNLFVVSLFLQPIQCESIRIYIF